MPTCKVIIDLRSKSKKGFPLKLWISHGKDTRTISFGVWCEKNQFDKEKVKVTGIKDSVAKTNILRKRQAQTELLFVKYNCKNLTCQQLKEKIETEVFQQSDPKSINLSEYVEILRHRLNLNQQYKTSDLYKDSLNSLISFRGKDLLLTDITVTFLEDFKAYQMGRGLKKNSISVYLRSLRAIINKARKEGVISKSHRPFEDINIPSGESKKEALEIEDLRKIRDTLFITDTPMWHHRNYFMFMFYCGGMNFRDFSFLKTNNIQGDYIVYRRQKTGKKFKIFIEGRIGQILNIYQSEDFIFPVLPEDTNIYSENAMKDSHQALRLHNTYLKRIAKALEIDINLTSYVARHTYAKIARLKGFDPKQVSEVFGHSSSLITEKHYYPDASQDLVNNINREVIDF